MVARLHDAGLEVILDVVYNHTAEGNELGPTLSFKGIDNASYYRLLPDQPRYYINDTGTGNTVNLSHPRVLQMVTDSLRYWVSEMHVDGFRFDLATILGREPHGFDEGGGFLDSCRQDPVLSTREADRRALGHRPGRLPGRRLPARLGGVERPVPRHGARLLERATRASVGDLAVAAHRLGATCSTSAGGKPWASVNFVTAHDGFTLHDLVSYNDKHNEANGEDNRDGHSDNLSWNHGVEGPTDDPRSSGAARAPEAQPAGDAAAVPGHADAAGRRRVRPHPAAATTTPTARTTRSAGSTGPIRNPRGDDGHALTTFVRRLTFLRHAFPILRRGRFLTAQWNEELEVKDVTWITRTAPR